jgi:hypothetical protein
MDQLVLSTTEHSLTSYLSTQNIDLSHLHHIMTTQVRSDRSLRIVTICTIIPASILLIATGISTRGILPTIGLVPMTLSALLGVVSLSSGNKGPIPYKSHMDLVLAIFLMAILVPTYVKCGTKKEPSDSNETDICCAFPAKQLGISDISLESTYGHAVLL